MTEEWLGFVVNCRRGKEHEFDIVDGPMADDQIWDYVEDYMTGAISKAAFWELVKFKYPTHQMVFCTEEALKTLRERSRKLDEKLRKFRLYQNIRDAIGGRYYRK